MNLGETICRLRTERGLSQGDLADALGVSRQSISKWETDSSVPELDKLVKLSQLFGVSLDELVMGTPAKKDTSTVTTPREEPFVPSQTAPQTHNLPGRKIAAIVLLCFGGLAFLLLTIMGGIAVGLLFSSPFLLCGVVCLIARKHPGLWCFWALYFLLDAWLRWATGITRHMIRLTSIWTAEMNYARLFMGWGMFVLTVLLILFTALRLRQKSFPPTAKNIALIAVGWAARFLLPQLMRFFPMRNLTAFLFDWAMLPLAAVMAVLTVRLIRSWRLAKRENS